MKFFEFNEDDYNYLVAKCMLNEDYAKLLDLKIKNYSIVKIADILGYGTSTISNMVKRLKKKIRRVLQNEEYK